MRISAQVVLLALAAGFAAWATLVRPQREALATVGEDGTAEFDAWFV